AEWREDQGVELRDEVNAEWTDLVVHKRSFPPNIKLTQKAKEMFFMVSYNIDDFRKFVFESTFLQRMPVDDRTREQLKTDDVALLKFGVKWLKSVLFKPKDPVTGKDIDLPEEEK
ncbi:MAG: YkgJ family cysteine cluster protein, partial [Desulfobacteraceae bacterium]